MIASLQRLFLDLMTSDETSEEEVPTLELATAALLFEVARADYHLDKRELTMLRNLLRRHFDLGGEALDELIHLAQQEAEAAVDHYQFVSLVSTHYSYAQRCELVRMMWSLALADNEPHPLEEHRIRRLADLLHVSHADFIRAKLLVQGHLDP
ncbi:TerB family tellurite resistance protein [Halomonas cerina]|uniref:Putative tellurite resistance protein B-like protein n=1 Tax=Halomonas cerina TaxID=447424 RepID=A0A839VAM3_9GAMM|nr:TerB family tellurite resistance protein [Halomonas cerina]MBB3192191.1 putative tellurite resistance protein B-like protein [Halomonas cerina]